MKNLEKNLNQKENYKLIISERAKKEMRKLPVSEIKKIDTQLLRLKMDPYFPGVKKLSGSTKTYRFRQGNYRVVYEVESQIRVVMIMAVGHRREVYS